MHSLAIFKRFVTHIFLRYLILKKNMRDAYKITIKI